MSKVSIMAVNTGGIHTYGREKILESGKARYAVVDIRAICGWLMREQKNNGYGVGGRIDDSFTARVNIMTSL